jgi:hypothetical protein
MQPTNQHTRIPEHVELPAHRLIPPLAHFLRTSQHPASHNPYILTISAAPKPNTSLRLILPIGTFELKQLNPDRHTDGRGAQRATDDPTLNAKLRNTALHIEYPNGQKLFRSAR